MNEEPIKIEYNYDEEWDIIFTDDDSIEYLPTTEIREKKINQLLDLD